MRKEELYLSNFPICQELDALIEAATEGEDAKFKFDEFRTLMTYPKCGIAKTVLGGTESALILLGS